KSFELLADHARDRGHVLLFVVPGSLRIQAWSIMCHQRPVFPFFPMEKFIIKIHVFKDKYTCFSAGSPPPDCYLASGFSPIKNGTPKDSIFFILKIVLFIGPRHKTKSHSLQSCC